MEISVLLPVIIQRLLLRVHVRVYPLPNVSLIAGSDLIIPPPAASLYLATRRPRNTAPRHDGLGPASSGGWRLEDAPRDCPTRSPTES